MLSGQLGLRKTTFGALGLESNGEYGGLHRTASALTIDEGKNQHRYNVPDDKDKLNHRSDRSGANWNVGAESDRPERRGQGGGDPAARDLSRLNLRKSMFASLFRISGRRPWTKRE